MFIVRVVEALNKMKLDYAIVGGFAMAIHGAVRGTIDLDLVINFKLKDFMSLEKGLLELGFKPRLPVTAETVFHFREEYLREKNLIAWSFYNPRLAYEVVDILLTNDLRKIKVIKKSFAGLELNVISIEDLIKMKIKANRPQDIADVEALKRVQFEEKRR